MQHDTDGLRQRTVSALRSGGRARGGPWLPAAAARNRPSPHAGSSTEIDAPGRTGGTVAATRRSTSSGAWASRRAVCAPIELRPPPDSRGRGWQPCGNRRVTSPPRIAGGPDGERRVGRRDRGRQPVPHDRSRRLGGAAGGDPADAARGRPGQAARHQRAHRPRRGGGRLPARCRACSTCTSAPPRTWPRCPRRSSARWRRGCRT